jgi:hypothetical protein
LPKRQRLIAFAGFRCNQSHQGLDRITVLSREVAQCLLLLFGKLLLFLPFVVIEFEPGFFGWARQPGLVGLFILSPLIGRGEVIGYCRFFFTAQ